jgi:hypothetical protein
VRRAFVLALHTRGGRTHQVVRARGQAERYRLLAQQRRVNLDGFEQTNIGY